MSMGLDLMQFVWPLFSLLTGAVQITAAVILLKDRHAGPWLMLAGAIVGLVSGLAGHGLAIAMNLGYRSSLVTMLQASSALGGLGWLVFMIGLLLHALRQRAKTNRIAELEMIIATLHNQR